jgi:hypothetical protein
MAFATIAQRLTAMADGGPGESYSDAILRLAATALTIRRDRQGKSPAKLDVAPKLPLLFG